MKGLVSDITLNSGKAKTLVQKKLVKLLRDGETYIIQKNLETSIYHLEVHSSHGQ